MYKMSFYKITRTKNGKTLTDYNELLKDLHLFLWGDYEHFDLRTEKGSWFSVDFLCSCTSNDFEILQSVRESQQDDDNIVEVIDNLEENTRRIRWLNK